MGFTMVGADAPLLVYQSAQDHPLPLLARQSGWRSRVPTRWILPKPLVRQRCICRAHRL